MDRGQYTKVSKDKITLLCFTCSKEFDCIPNKTEINIRRKKNPEGEIETFYYCSLQCLRGN